MPGNTDKKIREHFEKQTSSVYLTQINIIQAVVFSFYMVSIFWASKELIQQLSANPELIDQLIVIYRLAASNPAIFLQYGTFFLVVVLVWGEYALGSMMLKWTPAELDTFVPFLTGFLEIFAIVGIYSRLTTMWLMSFSMLCFLASLSYWHMYRASRRHPFSQSIIHKLEEGNVNWIKWNPLSLIAGGLILFSEAIAVGFCPSELVRTIVSIITFILLLFYLAKGCLYFQSAKKILKLP